MKILQINTVSGIGSTGRITNDIHNLMKKEGFESYVAYGRKDPLQTDHTIRIGTKLDNYIHVAKTRIFDQHGFGSKKATIKFIKKIEELNPDIIHLHNIHGYYVNVEILFMYLKKIRKPIVWTLHDCWPFTGHCVHFEYTKCKCWRLDEEHSCNQRSSYPKSWLLNNSKNNFKRKRKAFTGIEDLTIVTPSKWLAKLVRQSFLKEYPIKVINNGINLNVFKPIRSNFEEKYKLDNRFIILGVANVWDEKKGYEYFIELAHLLSRDTVLVLVGLNEEQIRNLPRRIIGIAQTDNVNNLVEIYSAADIFVNLTLEDNFPTTNLEALATGTPVVTFNTGGSGESIDEKSGFVVEQGNLAELLEKIKQIKQKGKIHYMKHAIKRSRDLYDQDHRFREYLELYKNLLAS